MATAEGYLRRLTRRLTEDPEQLDVEELSDDAANTGALKAIDARRGQEVTMVGTLRSVECNGKGVPAASKPSCSTVRTRCCWCGWGSAVFRVSNPGAR